MKQVAERAGVSTMTVSRALRSPDKVAADTLKCVQRAIETLGYVPDLVASSLASQRSRIIALIVPTVSSSIFDDSVQGIADTIGAEGYQLIIGQSRYSAEHEEALALTLLGRRPDGLVLIGTAHSNGLRARLKQAGVPVVETWDLTDDPIDSLVGFSNHDAGFAMTERLLDWGYQRIGFVGGTEEPRGAARRAGYEACLAARGVAAAPVTAFTDGLSMTSAATTFEALIEQHPTLDAVFFSSDTIAAGALFACQRRNWRVPDRIALAGLGDFEIAAQTVPALTTVRVPRYDIGRRAAEIILARLDGTVTQSQTVDLGFEIVRRDSA
jgi:LacI family gluconate utilization system Gnt-I transcriptional repressor